MVTKKDLQAKVDSLETLLEDARELRDEACNKLYAERQSHRDQLEAQAKGQFPLDWHLADMSYGQPFCLAGHYNNDEGLSLELYLDANGDLVGVVVMERGDLNSIKAVGMIPADTFSG